MTRQFIYIVRLAVLVLFCMYAMSPIYRSATTARNAKPFSCGEEPGVTVGIVWVNIVLSSMIDDGGSDAASGDAAVSSDDQDRDFVLIHKKRAVLRNAHDLAPLMKTILASVDDGDAIAPAAPVHEVPQDLRHRLQDSTHYLHLGLSPPLYSA